MKSIAFFVLLFSSLLATAQKTELDKRNGFKDIKMASPVDSVKGATFKKDLKENGLPAKLYSVDLTNYSSIGEVKINSIELRTYKGFIYQIEVLTEKDTRLMKGMEAALGPSTHNVRDETYNWGGENLSLKFKSRSKSQLELLYTSSIVLKMMAEDKKQKIKDISNDF